MIHSNMTTADYYKNIDEKIKICLEKAQEMDENTPCGRYDLAEGVYVNVMTYEPKATDCPICETHNNYADIQLILDGQEYMGYAPLDMLTQDSEYIVERDIQFWKGKVALLPVRKGEWVLFLPHEPHAPSISIDGKTVKKAVFKIRYAD